MGSIITVVEELLTHIDTNAVTAITANSSVRGSGSTRATTASATRRCRPHFSNDSPTRVPPRIRNSTGDM